MALIDANALRARIVEMERTAYSLGNRGRALAYNRVLEVIDDLEEQAIPAATPPAPAWPPASAADRVQVASISAASMPWDPARE